MRRRLGLAVGGLVVAWSALAGAQVNQVKPRVMIMLDTSGSMTEHIDSNTNSRGDGSTKYTDSIMTRDLATWGSEALYVGVETGTATCPSTATTGYDGVNSRMFNGKAAITNVINGSGDIDWGLMRYTGYDCPLVETFTATTGTCTNDEACAADEFCVGGKCGTVNNLCEVNGYGGTNKRGGTTCGGHSNLPVTYGGDQLGNVDATSCGVGITGGLTTACATLQTCVNGDADCNGKAVGSCQLVGTGPVKACKGTGGFTCPANYVLQTSGANTGFCVYSLGCQSIGGQVVVDPAAASFSNAQVLPWVDGIEDYSIGTTKSGTTAAVVTGASGTGQVRITGLSGMAFTDVGKALQLSGAASAGNNGYFTIVNFVGTTTVDVYNANAVINDTKNNTISWNVKYPANPELRAINNTPLAGAARTATTWYKNVIGADPVKECRPYVLVQITDGFDTCEGSGTTNGSTTAGPVAAAQAFVGATVAGKPSKPLNKVYVVGLNLSSPTLDQIAAAGGTGAARLATSQQDIEAALADIVASSVLVEKCNYFDDNCNSQCDENFPGVGVTNPGSDGQLCNNAHSPSACDTGYPAGTHCYAQNHYVCSTDFLSQTCSVATCLGGANATLSQPVAGTMRLTGVQNLTASMIGQLLLVGGSAQAGDNGLFVITAVGTNTVDVTNGAFVADASKVAYGVPTQGVSSAITMAGTVETITTSSAGAVGVNIGDTIQVLGAVPAADNGSFTVTAVTSDYTSDPTKAIYKISFTNAAAGTGTATTQGRFVVDLNLCPNMEVTGICNGVDDDCNGVIDDCTPGQANSCCTTCQPSAEICNGKDDNCNSIIDDNTIDSGSICSSNNVGDCAPSTWKCCSADPNLNGGACTQNASDKLYCAGGNPGYPVAGADKCDGTDDNCNGQANDGPPQICYTYVDANNMTQTLPMSKDGVGACHHGLQLCTTLPFCGTSGVTPPNCITGSCPAGWPAGKVCPNPTATYGACQGTIGPQTETCNGIDDDCDGVIDNNLGGVFDPNNPGHACCGPTGSNPLGDCMGVAGSACHVGGWACVAGVKSCVGYVLKTAEICDMQDNDCNGVVDDVPGKDTVCTGPGINSVGTCYGTNVCVYPPDPQASPNLVCRQKVGPSPEICNGLDDNCNGLIDDPPLVAGPGQPVPGSQCDIPMPPADKPPCMPGTIVCIAGQLSCQGAVHPMPNQCNGISTDCTGMPNTNGNCPSGFQCYQGNCVQPCQAGEFPCPGGYACDTKTTACDINGTHNGCCVPDACASMTCPLGFNCQLDANGVATCIDPCQNVTCPMGYICKLGACVDGSCRTQGCPNGQICVNTGTNMFECQPDACADVVCGANQFCQGGQCVNSCAGPCPTGQYCSEGQCVPDPCAHTPCVEGQVCRVQNGVGTCVENQCQFGCSIGQACCGGECVADQCANLHCPEDTHCALTPDCAATCETNPASPKDQIVGAGGGGFGCAVGGPASEQSSSLAWLIAVAGALLLRRRRTAEVRK